MQVGEPLYLLQAAYEGQDSLRPKGVAHKALVLIDGQGNIFEQVGQRVDIVALPPSCSAVSSAQLRPESVTSNLAELASTPPSIRGAAVVA